MAHPVNRAMPATAVVGLVSQVKVAPSGVLRVRVTVLVSVVTVFPAASWMVTTGWRAHPVSLVAVGLGLGAVLKASLAGAPAVMVIVLLVLPLVLAVRLGGVAPVRRFGAVLF